MAITKEEYEQLTDKIHAWDIRDQLDNAMGGEMYDALWKLYEKAKRIIDPEYCEFKENTNELLSDLFDDAEELQMHVFDIKEKAEAVYDMLAKITEAMPESLFDDDSQC